MIEELICRVSQCDACHDSIVSLLKMLSSYDLNATQPATHRALTIGQEILTVDIQLFYHHKATL